MPDEIDIRFETKLYAIPQPFDELGSEIREFQRVQNTEQQATIFR